MFHDLGTLALKSGEVVSLGVAVGPEPEWAEAILGMLIHKGDPWQWQNGEMLRQDCGVDVRFYILHRAGEPFSNIMTVCHRGVGILGHVWTRPEDRRQGAASLLMTQLMGDFRANGGHALFLGTGYDKHPYHIYRAFGFEGVEPKSGYMAYYTTSQAEFDAAYFAPGDWTLESFAWRHWPSACALFLGDFPGLVRCAPVRVFGRSSAEGPLLPLVRAEQVRREKGEPARVRVLENAATGAVAGLAAWDAHSLWPDLVSVDVYCHPAHWQAAPDLLGSLELPAGAHCIAYVDGGCPAKMDVLVAAGFRPTVDLGRRVAADRAKTDYVDILALEKMV